MKIFSQALNNACEIDQLLKAKEDAKRKVKNESSAANLAALSRATKMLDAAMSNQTGNKSFPDLKSVPAYLKAPGRKISQAKLYQDFNKGCLRRQPDKAFRQRDVDNYAATLKIVSMPEARTDGVIDIAEKELEEEVLKTRQQRMSIASDRQIKAGKYILREEVARELARAGRLRCFFPSAACSG